MDPDSGIPSCKLGSLAATPSVSPLTAWVDAPAGMVLSSDDSRSFVADKAALTTRVFDPGIGNLLAGLRLDSVPQSFRRSPKAIHDKRCRRSA